MASHPTSSNTPTRSRFSVILPLNSDTRSTVFRRKPSINSMSSDAPSPSSPPNSTRRTSSISPTRVFPIFANSWHRSPLHNLNSKGSESCEPASPTPGGKVGLTNRARKFGKRFGGTVEQFAASPDENDQNDQGAIRDTPPPRLSLSRTKSQPSNSRPSTPSGDGPVNPAATQLSLHRLSTSSKPSPDNDVTQDRMSRRSGSISKSSLKSVSGADTQSVFSFSPHLDLDYRRKARLTKLSRHLGEDIPPDLVLSNVSISSAAVHDDSATRTPSTTQSHSRRPSTASPDCGVDESRDEGKKRRSLDASSLKRPLFTPSVTNTVEDKRAVLVKRKRSLWMVHARLAEKSKVSGQSSKDVQTCDEQNDADSRGLEKHVSQKQRALNVRRARKMAQMFGSEPPPRLFLIDKKEDEDEDGLDLVEANRQSIATLLALSSVDPLSSFPSRLRVDSTASIEPSTSIEGVEDIGPLPSEPFSALTQSASLAQLASTSYSHVSRSKSVDTTAIFRERRLRAAKLSRFFGVEYQDITSALVTPEVSALDKPSTPPVKDESSTAVDVKVSAPARFWGLSEGRTRDAEVADVIGKLRGLKAG